MGSVHRERRQDVVVQRALKGIHVGGVPKRAVHLTGPKSKRDPGAGFQIRVVGQIVLGAELLLLVLRADAAADVKLGGHDVVPKAFGGVQVFPIAGFHPHGGEAGIHQSGAGRFPKSFTADFETMNVPGSAGELPRRRRTFPCG